MITRTCSTVQDDLEEGKSKNKHWTGEGLGWRQGTRNREDSKYVRCIHCHHVQYTMCIFVQIEKSAGLITEMEFRAGEQNGSPRQTWLGKNRTMMPGEFQIIHDCVKSLTVKFSSATASNTHSEGHYACDFDMVKVWLEGNTSVVAATAAKLLFVQLSARSELSVHLTCLCDIHYLTRTELCVN